MSILNVNTIQPVGTGQTVTVSATDLKIGTTTLSSGGSGTFVGNVTGNVTGNITGNVTGNINSTGISTFTTIRGSSNTITVPTGHRVVGVDTGSVYAPGTLVQYREYRVPSVNDDYVTISENVIYDTPVTVSITPIFSNSRLIIHAECQTRIIPSEGISAMIKRDGSAINGSYQRNSLYFAYKGDEVNHHYQVHCNTSVVSNSTNSTTFLLSIQPYGGSGEFNYGWGNNYIQVWEVAQ
jgi:hypothetical protein